MEEKVIWEPARKIEVIDEADVIVCGGGPAGVAAAISAAREEVSVILLERYGHLGGLATGGLVILLPHLSDGSSECQIRGIVEEVVHRLDKKEGALHPRWEDLGKDERELLKKWRNYFSTVVEDKIRMSVYFDPEMLKCVFNEMLMESKVKVYLHSWIAGVVGEDSEIKAIIIESKEGRKGIKGRVVIDATGDGDIFYWTGEDYATFDPYSTKVRSSHVALVFRLGNVNVVKFNSFREECADEYKRLLEELEGRVGFRMLPLLAWRDDVVWVNNWLPGINPLKIEDLTKAEMKLREAMLIAYKVFKEKLPGFEECYIMDTAPQLGVRGTRRLKGQHVLSKGDLLEGKVPPDPVAVFPPINHNASDKHPNVYLPLRCLLPRKTKNLIVAGRCFSSDEFANDLYNLIPHCMAMGQAAGIIAAVSIKNAASPINIDYQEVRSTLAKQGVFLGEQK